MMKLHLGCGPKLLEGWINLDIETGFDLSKGLPWYHEGEVGFIFTEHFLEHLTREQGLVLLKECRRVLKPGGVIRIVVPSLEALVKKYRNSDLDWGGPGGWEPKTPCQMMNEGCRSWGHNFMYDYDELILILQEAGFSDVSIPGYRTSTHLELCHLETRPEATDIRVEAKR